MTSEMKMCQNCKQSFVIEPEDFEFYEKIKVPAPSWCPDCRLQRRLAWRNERTLYRRKCDRCGKGIISVYPPDAKLTVYCRPCWWRDDWDGRVYGKDFDPSKPFLLQIRELLSRVPLPDLFGLYTTLENSEYVNMVGWLKNCYLLFHSDNNENCSYGSMIGNSRDCFDNIMLSESELCYETVNCRKCYHAFYSVDCDSCHNVLFCRNCIGCSNCIGCVNQKNKRYLIFNEQATKEEYESWMKQLAPLTHQRIEELQKKASEIWTLYPQKFMHERQNFNVSGDYIYEAKNVKDTFVASKIEDFRFCALITPPAVSDCYDFTHYGQSASQVYESLQVGDEANRVLFSWFACTNVEDIEYSMHTVSSKELFGCVGLKKQECCILNKQYSKKEYEKMRLEIIDQMTKVPYTDKKGIAYPYGEFWPIELSPFPYNTTTAEEEFPLTREVIEECGYHFKEREQSKYQATQKTGEMPASIHLVSDTALNEIIECAHRAKYGDECPGAFRITSSELEFCRKLELPLPVLCPHCRHKRRCAYRNPMRLWKRTCDCNGQYSKGEVYTNATPHSHKEQRCLVERMSTYAPDRPEQVYCETCYQSEVA